MRLSPGFALRSARVGRLPLLFGLAFALAMLVVGIIALGVADRWVANRIDASLRYDTTKYLRTPSGGIVPDGAIVARIVQWQQRKVLRERTYLLFDRNGRRIAGQLDVAPPAPGLSDVPFLDGGRSLQWGRALATRLPSGNLFVVVQYSEAAASLRALLPWTVAVIAIVALVTGLSAILLLGRRTARRLAHTQSAARAIAAGDLNRRIAVDRLDGMFRAEAETLNHLLDRMEERVRAQRLFTGHLAYDLRTPLTRLRILLARGAAEGDPQLAAVFERAERECTSIVAIFDALLRLAEIETGRHPSAMARLSLRPLIEDVADTMEPVIADHGGRLEVGRLDDVTITGDSDMINQLLINLLENIANHTPIGTCARLTLERDGDGALITVRDDGPGLATGDLTRVTQPFERGASVSQARGSGLGLAIAQAIVRFHHGQLDLANTAPGLEIRVRIPANDPRPRAQAMPPHAAS